jgi:hypothetical protein
MADTEELASKPNRRTAKERSKKNTKAAAAAAAKRTHKGRQAAAAGPPRADAAPTAGKRSIQRSTGSHAKRNGRHAPRKSAKQPKPIASSVLRREKKKQVPGGSTSGKLEVDNEIAKQRAIVARLRNENKSLEQELSLEKHLSAVSGRDAAQKEIEKLQATGDKLARRIQQEKRRIEQLDAGIAETQEKITKQQLRVGGANASKENARRLDKHIKLLESRLDNALKRYNKALAVNKGLRKQVDESRQERVIFDGVYKKLEWQLHENKLRIKELDKQAETASEARDTAKDELRKITEEAEQARVDFEKHWRQLGEEIAADRAAKGKQQRDETQLNVANAQMGRDGDGTKDGSKDIRGDKILSQKDSVQSAIAKSKWSIGKDKIHTVLSLEKVKEYEEAFKKIQNATGIKDIETLVEQFIEAEDNNFALYSHVNRLSAESERLEQAMADVRGEIEKYRGQGANTVNQRKRILKSVESNLEASEKRAEDYEFRHEEVLKILGKIKDGTQRLFTRIGCYSPDVADMLGDQGVTDSNIMQYLGIIEQRANEVLHLHAAAENGGANAVHAILFASARQGSILGGGGRGSTPGSMSSAAALANGRDRPTSQKLTDFDSILGAGARTQHEHAPVHVEPPSIDAFDAEEEMASITGISSERPIPREELQRKTQELSQKTRSR